MSRVKILTLLFTLGYYRTFCRVVMNVMCMYMFYEPTSKFQVYVFSTLYSVQRNVATTNHRRYGDLTGQPPAGSEQSLHSSCTEGDHIKLYIWFGKLSASIKRL